MKRLAIWPVRCEEVRASPARSRWNQLCFGAGLGCSSFFGGTSSFFGSGGLGAAFPLLSSWLGVPLPSPDPLPNNPLPPSPAWHEVDTANYNVNLYHFAYALKKPTSNVLFWVTTTIESPREMTGVRLAIGSNAASRWWLNDDPVIALNDDRQAVIDDGVSRRLTLRKGRNVIRAAIINGGGATDFCARFLDENDKPLQDLKVITP